MLQMDGSFGWSTNTGSAFVSVKLNPVRSEKWLSQLLILALYLGQIHGNGLEENPFSPVPATPSLMVVQK